MGTYVSPETWLKIQVNSKRNVMCEINDVNIIIRTRRILCDQNVGQLEERGKWISI